MPFKIYTYLDPYKLDQTDFWPEISTLPHFCVSRTLVNGLKANIQNNIHGLICPFDDLVTHVDIYYDWTNNISLRVQQRSELTKLFNSYRRKGRINNQFYISLQQNESHFLNAIRLFIELGISASSLDASQGNSEQKLFVDALSKLEKSPSFQFPETESVEKLKDTLINLAEVEFRDRHSRHEEDNAWYERMLNNTRNQTLTSIVVHGVHQFTPAQLHLIVELDKMGIQIIFLYNYQTQYPRLYSSWEKIYAPFGVTPHHDTKIEEYITEGMQTSSNALACAIGEVFEGRYRPGENTFKNLHKLFENIPLLEFENVTEYAHFVSNNVHEAERSIRKEMGPMNDRPIPQHKVLSRMTESVYTANRDIHTLLKIYHPEFSKDRHFLSYPIGQFFSGIYKLWNYDLKEIDIEIPPLKECLSSNILNSKWGANLLRTFYNVEAVFQNIKTFSDFEKLYKKQYLDNYDKIASAKPNDPIAKLRCLSIYNPVKAPRNDVIDLGRAIEELNGIAKELFSQDTKGDHIDFGQHFEKLEQFLRQRDLIYASQEERALISALQARLDSIHPEQSAFSGTFSDLKEGIHYYLKQKENEDSVDWIVKNFEQIDGDILNSRRQFMADIDKVYHFGCLSDRDMNHKLSELLPWPLTEGFIQNAYNPIDLQFQVYWTAMDERSNFLRYALFYGLFFNRCPVRLSYVKQYEDEVTEPFALLSLLGFTPKHYISDNDRLSSNYSISIASSAVQSVNYDRIQMMDMYLCPYRYLLDYVVQSAPVLQGEILYKKFFENLLVEAVWKRMQGHPRAVAEMYYKQAVNQECEKFKSLFSFWSRTDLSDLRRRAANYLYHHVIKKDQTIRKLDPEFLKIRLAFGAARYNIDISESEPYNPYANFENLTQTAYPTKIYSMMKIPRQPSNALLKDAKEYINNSSDNYPIASEWCVYCPEQQRACVYSFLKDT